MSGVRGYNFSPFNVDRYRASLTFHSLLQWAISVQMSQLTQKMVIKATANKLVPILYLTTIQWLSLNHGIQPDLYYNLLGK